MSYSQETQDRTYAIMDRCDTAYREGRFDDIDNELLTLDVDSFDTFQCRTWSICAWWARDRLKNCEEFRSRCHRRVAELKGADYADRLIKLK
jgi:hypothetical protein